MVNVRDYKVEISKLSKEDGGGYLAHIPQLDCYGDGETVEAAIADVYTVAEDLIEIAGEDGKEVPMPQYYRDMDEFSGKLSIRLPKTLHKQLSLRAKMEECSINQLVATYISMGVGDAYGRVASLVEKQEDSIGNANLLLSLTKEMWKEAQKQKFDFPREFLAINHKGGQKRETGF